MSPRVLSPCRASSRRCSAGYSGHPRQAAARADGAARDLAGNRIRCGKARQYAKGAAEPADALGGQGHQEGIAPCPHDDLPRLVRCPSRHEREHARPAVRVLEFPQVFRECRKPRGIRAEVQPRDPEREGEAAKAVREFAGVRHIAAMGREVQQSPGAASSLRSLPTGRISASRPHSVRSSSRVVTTTRPRRDERTHPVPAAGLATTAGLSALSNTSNQRLLLASRSSHSRSVASAPAGPDYLQVVHARAELACYRDQPAKAGLVGRGNPPYVITARGGRTLAAGTLQRTKSRS